MKKNNDLFLMLAAVNAILFGLGGPIFCGIVALLMLLGYWFL